MLIKQISVFIENKLGRLAQVTGYLADNDINIHAISIADTTDFGILRLIVEDPEKACRVLKENGLTVKMTNVISVALEHRPGSLSRVLGELDSQGLNIEYMYAFTSRSPEHDAMVILRLADQESVLDKLKSIDSIKILDRRIVNQLGSVK